MIMKKEITNCRVGTAHEGFQSTYDCPKSRFRMMSNHIDARSWAVPTLQNDLLAYQPVNLLVTLRLPRSSR
jgi:hypothetical protein